MALSVGVVNTNSVVLSPAIVVCGSGENVVLAMGTSVVTADVS